MTKMKSPSVSSVAGSVSEDQQRPDQRVDEAERERRDQRGDERIDLHPREDIRKRQQRQRVDEPDEQETRMKGFSEARTATGASAPRRRNRVSGRRRASR